MTKPVSNQHTDECPISEAGGEAGLWGLSDAYPIITRKAASLWVYLFVA